MEINAFTASQTSYIKRLTFFNDIKLSKREIDVVACILNGKAAKGTAQLLSISFRTAEAHTYNVMKKLNCSSREGLISMVENSDKYILFRDYYYSFLLKNDPSEQPIIEISKEASKQNQIFEKNNSSGCLSPKKEVSYQNIWFSVRGLMVKGKLGFFLIIFLTLMSLCAVGFIYTRNKGKEHHIVTSHVPTGNLQDVPIRSDLIFPNDINLISRSQVLTEINAKLKGQNGIQSIALVGIGGVGKTTLARQYAHQQKAAVIWEINAETHNTLKESFEKLAYALSRTEEDKKVLRTLYDLEMDSEREERILQFVREHLRAHSNWLLIFDNVEKFIEVQKYFPRDPATWGHGKVLVTTRDSNIQNNTYLSHVIYIGELDPSQKLAFFLHLLSNGKPHRLGPAQEEKLKIFLDQLPPFPLDISIAAYYLKAVHISYEEYLESLQEHSQDFADIQHNLLREATDYAKTRLDLVTLSLEVLINMHQDFKDLLLLISLIGSQEIPKNLLNKYKDKKIVDNFIYNLKKYSLITTESPHGSSISTFSLHRSIQEITLAYLKNKLKLSQDTDALSLISEVLENYLLDGIETEDIASMKLLVGHCESFLSRDRLLTNNMKGSIDGRLGWAYYCLGEHTKARQTLEKSLTELKETDPKNRIKLSSALRFLGHVYRELGDYDKAQNFLEQSLTICQTYFPENDTLNALVLSHLGGVYMELGNNEKAKHFLGQSLSLYHKQSENHIGVAWALADLGNIYKNLGKYAKAEEVFKESLIVFSKSSKSRQGNAWVLMHLGDLYRELANYQQAKDCLTQSVAIYKDIAGDHNIRTFWALAYLGRLYKDLKDSKEAISLLEQSLNIHKRHFGENHIKVAWILLHLGNTYVDVGNYEKARDLLEKSLIVYEKHYGPKHLETAGVLKNLGQAYLLQGDKHTAEIYFNKALEISQQNNHIELSSDIKTGGKTKN